jgi:acyl-CoA synthetase (AMP-forming)/AMP-acid ligase II
MAVAYGGAEAVVSDRGRVTYAELESRSAVLARGLLARGVSKGTRIGLWLGNSADWVVSFLAVARCGAVAVPLSTFFSDAELAAVVRHADLAGMVVHPQFLGEDQRDRLAAAIAGLAGCGAPPWAVPAAPHLRWVVALDEDRPAGDPGSPWAVGRRWLSDAAATPGFDDRLLAAAEAEVFADDDAIMIYTSGTSSMAKGVPHSHRGMLEKVHYLREWMGVADGVRSYIASPFFWVGGLTMSLFLVLDGGGTQYCTDRFDAGQVLELVATERIERAVLYPHHVNALVEHPDFATADRSSLTEADPRVLLAGVARPTDPEALRIGIGMTETFGGYWWGRARPVPGEPPLRPGERRPPPLELSQPGVEIKVVDPDNRPVVDGEMGEICLRGMSVTRGLHKLARDTVIDADGWFHTGDRVLVDGPRLWFRGRLGDMIKTAGANVSPSEVVGELRDIDGVADAYVFGLPDPVRGQVVVSVVVPVAGRTLDAEAIRATLKDRLSTFKVPAEIVFFTEADIPWTASHKVRTAKLVELAAERLGDQVGTGSP